MANFRTEAEMFPLVEQWQGSGQTQKVFCATHNISISVLAYWLRRYRDRYTESHEADCRPEAGFVAVQMAASSDCGSLPGRSSPTALEVSLPSGAVLRFGQIVPVGYLKALL
jgi:hypothetical protein